METVLFHDDIVTTNRILYTPSTFAKKNLYYLQETGFLQANKIHVSQRTHLDSFLFFLVVSGSGKLEYQGKKYPLNPGDGVFLDCSVPYLHETGKHLWSLKWVHFNGPCAKAIYRKYRSRGGSVVFHPNRNVDYVNLLSSLYQVAESKDYLRDMEINEKLNALLSLLMGESVHQKEKQDSSSKRDDLARIKQYLDEHYRESIKLDDLSEMFFLNKFYLTRIFKNQYGMSIDEYLLQCRISEAKQSLRFTEKSIDEISGEVGFSDQNYFARQFKKVEGTSPSAYRRAWEG